MSLPERWVPLALLSPAMLFLGLFHLAPAVLTPIVALFRWDELAGTVQWTGVDAYARMLTSDELVDGLVHTILYTLMTVPLTVGGGLLCAVAINSLARGRTLWRAVYFLPVAATPVAAATAWRWLFRPESGIIDKALGTDGWLTSTTLALPAIAIVGNWQYIGLTTVIFLAGLAAVPPHLVDAARLDGARGIARFWHVTWPALGPATVFATVLTTTLAFRVYDSVAVLTEGGPLGATETLTYLIWERGINYADLSGGAVVTVALLVVVLTVTVWQMRSFGRRLEKAGSR